MTHCNYTSAVWPTPPDNHSYATPSFPGGSYITTGYFRDCDLSGNGVGRSHENCVQVTSLFFDVDCVGLLDAVRAASGQELERKVKDRKAVLYSLEEGEVERLKDNILGSCGEILSEVMGEDPTAIIDSGWGWHFHYAFEGECDPVALQEMMKGIIAHLNSRVQDHYITHHNGVLWPKAFDATHDVGVRLARRPGSVNSKAPGNPKTVTVIAGDENVCFRYDHIVELYEALPTPEPTIDLSGVAPAQSVAPSTQQGPSGNSRVYVDFNTYTLNDGRTWQQVADALGANERINVVCPFEGTSVGSAFFAKDAAGRTRFVSNATNATYLNTYTAPTTPPPGNTPPPPPSTTPPPAAPPPAAPTGRTFASIPPQYQRRDRNGNPMGATRPVPMHHTLCLVLRGDSLFDLWYDDFRQVVMNGSEPATDRLYTNIIVALETDYDWRTNRPSKDALWNAVESVARNSSRNPVTEYLDGLEWDGVPRVNDWIFHTIYAPAAAVGCPIGTNLWDYCRAISRKWAISLVARAYQPGCKVDTVLGITGRQGFRKSTLFRAWCPMPDLFVDTPLDMGSKDKYLTLQRAWIYEDAEMASGTRAQEEAKKAFLSSPSDTFRSPYSRTMQTVPRHTVIVATSNEDNVLKDRTGSRRYWLVEAPSFKHLPDSHPDQPLADIDWLVQNREQLLAEAVVAYKAGEEWWLTADEDARRAELNERFTHTSLWVENATAVFDANCGGFKNGITCKEFAKATDSELADSQIAKIGMTLSGALKQAGFRKHDKKRQGKTVYYKPIPEGVDVMTNNGLDAIRSYIKIDEDSFRRNF